MNTRQDAQTMTSQLSGKWHGRYGTAPCPVCQTEARRDQNGLSIKNGSDGRILVHCFKSACAFTDILAAAGVNRNFFGNDPVIREGHVKNEATKKDRRAAQAKRLWHEGKPIEHTIVHSYLRSRGIKLNKIKYLRFHSACWHGPTAEFHPAMVAAVRGAGVPAVHRTYLRTDGTGKARLDGGDKLMLGATAGGAVRLTEGNGPFLIGEGIESTLSAYQLKDDPSACAWATLSVSGMRGLRLPKLGRLGRLGSNRKDLIIAVDGDPAGRKAGRDLAERAAGLGWRVSIADPGDGVDWNDRLIERDHKNGL